MTLLLDTHAWLWWVTEDTRLSKKAAKAISTAEASNDIWVSPISIWEIAKKVEKNQLVLDRPLDEWFDAALAREGLHGIELSRAVLVESCRLPQPFHGDPADQIIVATARLHNTTLITKDEKLQDYSHVRTLW